MSVVSQDIEQSARFVPPVPKALEETGLTSVMLEDLIFKVMLNKGAMTGRDLAQDLCLHFGIVEKLLADMKQRLLIGHKESGTMGDFVYVLTDQGQAKGMVAREISNFSGAAPVPFKDYLASVNVQSIRNESPGLAQLQEAFEGLVFEDKLFDTIGPAVNSGRGLFLYGVPGNGKTTIAERMCACFKNDIFIPKSILIEGQILQLYDPQNHVPFETEEDKPLIAKYDQRWIRIRRRLWILNTTPF